MWPLQSVKGHMAVSRVLLVSLWGGKGTSRPRGARTALPASPPLTLLLLPETRLCYHPCKDQ